MSNEILDWTNIETEIDDLNEVVTVPSECTDTSNSELHQAPLNARQKLEIYWERKRLEENLYDVLSNTRRMDTGLRNDSAGTSTLN